MKNPGLIRDESVLDYNDLPDPLESVEECTGKPEENDETEDIFVIALIEHKSGVEYNVTMQKSCIGSPDA